MFSTKGRYALRVMIDLAQHNGDELVPLKDIAERQDISKKYLEIIAKEMGFYNGKNYGLWRTTIKVLELLSILTVRIVYRLVRLQ